MFLYNLKQTAIDIWDEMLYLMFSNVMWLIGTLLVIPFPLVTFALFFVARDVSQGRGISFGLFFKYARQSWKSAYIWGGLNLGLGIVILVNLNFYAAFQAQWADFVRLFILALTLFWLLLQLIVLALYPRLEEPGFKLAMRNGLVLIGRQPITTFALFIVVVLLVGLSVGLPVIGSLIGFAAIAVLTNRMVGAYVAQEMDRLPSAEE